MCTGGLCSEFRMRAGYEGMNTNMNVHLNWPLIKDLCEMYTLTPEVWTALFGTTQRGGIQLVSWRNAEDVS